MSNTSNLTTYVIVIGLWNYENICMWKYWPVQYLKVDTHLKSLINLLTAHKSWDANILKCECRYKSFYCPVIEKCVANPPYL